MASEPEVLKTAEIIPIELKQEPRSKGIATPRKKKPKELAVITECCTGCAGSPACVEYCPIEDCMFWVPDEDHTPFTNPGRPDSLHWLQEVHQQRPGWFIPRRLPLGCDRNGRDGRSRERSRRHAALAFRNPVIPSGAKWLACQPLCEVEEPALFFSGPDGSFGLQCLLAHAIRNIGQLSFVRQDCGEILGLTNEIEGPQRL